MKKRIAHLVYRQVDEVDEYGKFVDIHFEVVRLTNPVIDGKRTGNGWFAPSVRTSLTAQEFADKHREVVFDETTGEYVYPRQKGGELYAPNHRVYCLRKEPCRGNG